MLNEGGCGRLSPGIGNISYVKARSSDWGNCHDKISLFTIQLLSFQVRRLKYVILYNLVPSQYSKFELT
jgi:hypothetical protein